MTDSRSVCAGGIVAEATRTAPAATFARISTYRRTARDYERLPATIEAMLSWFMIALVTRRPASPPVYPASMPAYVAQVSCANLGR